MKVYQQSDVDFVHPICNFIKSEALAHAFSCELCKFSHPAILLQKNLRQRSALVNFGIFFRQQLYQKWDSSRGFFPWILRSFSASNFTKTETQAQAFSCEFCKTINDTYSAEHLWRVASNDMIIARFFCKFYCSLKSKTTGHQR